MKRSLINKNLFICLFYIFLCVLLNDRVYALEPKIAKCTMSDEYAHWLTLSEEEQNEVMRPAYCDSNADKTNIAVSSVTSKIDSMFSSEMTTSATDSTYDLRKTSYKPVLKDQKSTGGCWAFSTSTALEVAMKIKYGDSSVYSTRHIEYASTRGFKNNKINEYGYNRGVGSGGDYHMAASYLANGLGAVLESDMPFVEDESLIDINEIKKNAVLDVNDIALNIGSGGKACTSTEIKLIKDNIVKYGAVAASTYMYLSPEYYNSETGAYYYNGKKEINHALTIVGWDDNYSASNFGLTKPKKNGAWIVQNSYGTRNSDDGYNYVSYEDVRTCDQLMTIIDVDKDVDDNAYVLDKLGYNMFIGYQFNATSGSTSAYAMNVFSKKSGKSEVLKEVTIGSSGTGNYTIYYYDGNASDKTVGDMEKIGSGKLNHAGYVTHKFENPILLDNDVTDFSIAVYYDMDNSIVPVPVSAKDSTRYSPVSVNVEKTFASPNGKSWSDLAASEEGVLVASIKAFTDDFKGTIKLGRAKVSTSGSKYIVDVDFSSSGIDSDKIEINLVNRDDFEQPYSSFECTGKSFVLEIDKDGNVGKRVLTIYYEGNYIGEVEFSLNAPLTSKVYTINEKNGYIYVPPKTTKSQFKSNVSTLIEPELIGTTGYMYTGMIVENYIIIVKGDVSGDGVITPLDYIKVKNHIMSTELIKKDAFVIAADYNDDSEISPLDYVKIKNYIMKG